MVVATPGTEKKKCIPLGNPSKRPTILHCLRGCFNVTSIQIWDLSPTHPRPEAQPNPMDWEELPWSIPVYYYRSLFLQQWLKWGLYCLRTSITSCSPLYSYHPQHTQHPSCFPAHRRHCLLWTKSHKHLSLRLLCTLRQFTGDLPLVCKIPGPICLNFVLFWSLCCQKASKHRFEWGLDSKTHTALNSI